VSRSHDSIHKKWVQLLHQSDVLWTLENRGTQVEVRIARQSGLKGEALAGGPLSAPVQAMRIAKYGLLATVIFVANGVTATATARISLRGAVITTEGKMMPEFTVTAKPITKEPEFAVRHRFTNGIFSLEGLVAEKYQIIIEAPLHVRTRMLLDLRDRPSSEHFRVVILYPFRNEVRYLADSDSVSVMALQQDVPSKAKRAYQEAVAFHREGRWEEALSAYGRAIRDYPRYRDALADVGALYILLNQVSAGLSYLQRALAIDRQDLLVQINIAIAYSALGDFGKASHILHGVLRKEARKTWPRYVLARTLFQQRDYGGALESVRLALEESPRLLDAWVLLLNLGIELRDASVVREALVQIRSLAPSPDFSGFVDDHIAFMLACGDGHSLCSRSTGRQEHR